MAIADQVVSRAARAGARVAVGDAAIDIHTGLFVERRPIIVRLSGARYVLTLNATLFVGLLLVVPVRRLRARWGYVLTAGALLFALQSLFFTLGILCDISGPYLERGEPLLSASLVDLLRVVWQTYGQLSLVIPFLLVAPVFLLREPEPRAGARRPRGPADPARAGRNDPCPCGSGRKFKRCCGA